MPDFAILLFYPKTRSMTVNRCKPPPREENSDKTD